MIRIFKKPQINFIGVRRQAFILSGALILVGIISIFMHRGLRYGIDFTGGSLVELHFDTPIGVAGIREKLSEVGLEGATIQEERGTTYNYLIRTEPRENMGAEIAQLFTPRPTVESEQLIGPSISMQFRQRALGVIFLGMIVMLIYVSIRFTFRFGITAVVALIHDLLITIGILSLFNKEISISIIAALLTIIGYSINDSIVISDRVRENLKILRKDTFANIVNSSLNETLSRTIITSLTTLCVLTILLFFGGRIIYDFAFALLIGVIIGTYSSIFIVAALVVEWEKAAPSSMRR